MASCATIRNNGNLRIRDPFDGSGTQANCDLVVMDQAEHIASSDLSASLTPLFDKYFGFDAELFAIVVGLTLVSFVGGVTLGHVARILRKT